MVKFSRIAGYIRMLIITLSCILYMAGSMFLIAKLIGFNVSNEVLRAGVILIISGIFIQFVIQELIARLLHKIGKTVFTSHQLKIGSKTYDLNKVNIYYYKPRLSNILTALPCAGLMKMDTHDDVFIHGSLTGKEIGIFSMREVKKIIKITGVKIELI